MHEMVRELLTVSRLPPVIIHIVHTCASELEQVTMLAVRRCKEGLIHVL